MRAALITRLTACIRSAFILGLHVDMMQLRAERGRLLDRCGAWPFAAGGPQRLVCLLKGSRGPKHICQLLMSGGSPPQISSQNPSFLTLMKGRFGISVRLMQGCSERPPILSSSE